MRNVRRARASIPYRPRVNSPRPLIASSLAALVLAQCSPTRPASDASLDVFDNDAPASDSAPAADTATPDAEPTDSGVWSPPAQCATATEWRGDASADGGDASADAGATTASVSGHAFDFSLGGGRIEGAYVTILEDPTRCVRTGRDGFFRFDGLTVGADVTLAMHDPRFPLIHTGTHTVPAEGIERLTFQAPTHRMYRLLATAVAITPRATRCQIAATVTEIGRSIYTTDWPSHGEAGATVTLTPARAMVDGPVYFQYYESGIIPERQLTETSRDGGVLFLNVEPGEYVLSASKAGVRFRSVRVRCIAGALVNASPPWSIQAY